MHRFKCNACVLFVTLLLGVAHSSVGAAEPPNSPAGESPMTVHATGTFEVNLVPLQLDQSTDGDLRGRMSINKTFQGDLEATSVGEMLTAMTATTGSAAYAAIERVTGTIGSRRGSFALQHTGIMDRGARDLRVTIVPDSGTDDLTGIAGTLAITIADGTHSYDLAYTLPDAPASNAD